MKKIISYMAFILFTTSMFSQSYNVKGQIITLDQKPIEFVEIYLYQNNSVLYETHTDSLGYFDFELKNSGIHNLHIEYLGTERLAREIIVNSDLDLGKIIIDDEMALNELVIEIQRKQIEKKVDRLVFNVASSIQSSGNNALEILKITPRVKVENDQVSMIGKSSMMVMIDDRIVQLSGNDLTNYLQSLHSDDIQSIEVITNPPAKYSAEGNSGIINIITKKNKDEAWNGSLQGTYRQGKYPIGIVNGYFNYK